MQDAAQNWGGDLALNATGDLALASGTRAGQQRVLRRLLTNPGDYIWHPTYGAGLASFIGQPVRPAAIAALIRSQMLLESAVAPTPVPQVDISADTGGQVFVSISYVDAPSGQTVLLEFAL